MKFTFTDFLNAKNHLMQQTLSNPTTKVTYVVKKYVKIPLLKEGTEHVVGLKPKDVIEIVWEFDESGRPIGCTSFIVESCVYNTNKPPSKIKGWLSTNTILDKDNWFV